MPIALSPQDKRLYWLKSDAEIPLAERPVFECKAPTRRVMIDYSMLADEATALKTGQPAFDKLIEMIKLGVTGWRNMGGRSFTLDGIEDFLSNAELQELAFNWPDAFDLGAEQRRGFTLPQLSDKDESANSAASLEAA